jgi:hypothetical protein
LTKQKIVALLSCEAEYVAATASACQGVWLKRLLGELLGHDNKAIELCVDNKSAIALMKNPVFHDRSKHIQTRYHFICSASTAATLTFSLNNCQEQLCHIMTKALGRVQFQGLRNRIGLVKVKDI